MGLPKYRDIGVLWNNQRESDLKIDSLAVRVDEIQENFLPRKLTIQPLVFVSSSKGVANVYPLDCTTALYTSILGIPTTRVSALKTSVSSSSSSSSSSPFTSRTARLFIAEENPQLYAAFFPPPGHHHPHHLMSTGGGARQRAMVTPALIQLLPTDLPRDSLLSSLSSTLILHPICSFQHLETRLRLLDGNNVGGAAYPPPQQATIALYALTAAAMTLASLAYQAERRAWKLPFDVPEHDRDITRLFDLARLSIRLAQEETEEEKMDVLMALLLLVIFVLHSIELDGHAAVMSGVIGKPVVDTLATLIDQMRRKADSMGLLNECAQMNAAVGKEVGALWTREQRRLLGSAVAYYEFMAQDHISNRVTLDHNSYTTEPPALVDYRCFRAKSETLSPPMAGGTNNNTYFATYRAKYVFYIFLKYFKLTYFVGF
jgi:hypothetical protein